MRLNRSNEPSVEQAPEDQGLASAGNLHAAIVDKQQRVARRKEANKEARRKRQEGSPTQSREIY